MLLVAVVRDELSACLVRVTSEKRTALCGGIQTEKLGQ